LDPSGNFNSYRATLKAAQWRSNGASQQCEKIIIPFFSLFIKDLLYLFEGCSRKLPNGHLNFAKFTPFAVMVRDFVSWKHVDCPFDRDTKLLQYILTSSVFDDCGLQLASFECETPDLPSDKDQYKQLKLKYKWSL